MDRIRRFMAEFVDLFVIWIVYQNLNSHFSSNSLILIGIFYWLLKDCFFEKGSIGKQLFNLMIPISTTKNESLYKKMIFRNFLDMIFLPLSLCCCLLFKWSLSDIYYKEELKVSAENGSINKFSKIGYFFCTVVIVILLAFETFNYYSIRLIIFIALFILCSILYDKFMKSLKYGKFIIIAMFLILSIGESKILYRAKFKNLSDCFHYNFPTHEILKMYEFDNYAYVIYKRENRVSITNYLKSNNAWIAKGHNPKYVKNYSETEKIIHANKWIIGEQIMDDKTYALMASIISKYDKAMFLIVANYQLEEPIVLYDRSNSETEVDYFPLLYHYDLPGNRDDYYIYGLFLDYEESKNCFVKIENNVHSFYY